MESGGCFFIAQLCTFPVLAAVVISWLWPPAILVAIPFAIIGLLAFAAGMFKI